MHYSEVDETATGSANFWSEGVALAACAEAVDALGRDLVVHALLARSEVGVFVLPQVLPSEHVDVFEGALADYRCRAAALPEPGLLAFAGWDGAGPPGIR